MAETFNQQAHLWPLSGITGFRDGDGMSAHIARDLGPNINNLARRVAKQVNHVSSITNVLASLGHVRQTLHTASREIYLGQTQLILDPTARRHAWIVGIEGLSPGAQNAVITQVKLYLAYVPYLGPAGAAAAFVASHLPATGVISRSVTLTIDTATEAYEKAIDTATGFEQMPVTMGRSEYRVWAIMTATGYCTSGDGVVAAHDFTFWAKPD